MLNRVNTAAAADTRSTTSAPDAEIATRIRERLPIVRMFFAREAARITAAAGALAERFERGGTLYAFGRHAYSTDAAHLSVEFVHPVIVGKTALPAFDLSAAPPELVAALLRPADIAIALGPPDGDPLLADVLAGAARRGALTLALPGAAADYAFEAPCSDEHIHQEVFELLGHTLYESVHVFLEARGRGSGTGASSFLYPFLDAGTARGVDPAGITASILRKVEDGAALREELAATQTSALAAAADAIDERLAAGGRILALGNGGSATDATDFVLDCVMPVAGMPTIPALSLSAEPAVLSAMGNDLGMEHTFLRQLIARAKPNDVVLAFSTSGGSKNVVAALEEARRRGLLSVAILGYDGGDIVRRKLADFAIVVGSVDIPRIQETQATIYHVLRERLGRHRAP
jgi:D-sedoheptulose 7-phosphate isomerase